MPDDNNAYPQYILELTDEDELFQELKKLLQDPERRAYAPIGSQAPMYYHADSILDIYQRLGEATGGFVLSSRVIHAKQLLLSGRSKSDLVYILRGTVSLLIGDTRDRQRWHNLVDDVSTYIFSFREND